MKTIAITGGEQYLEMLEFSKILKNDCQRYLNESQMLKSGWLFRMMNPNDVFKEIHVRNDRYPRDTPLSLHLLIDKYFFDNFGIPFRSSGVFCVNNPSYIINEYPANKGIANTQHVLFPIGDYSSCSSSKYRDVLLILQNSYRKEIEEFKQTDDLDDISNDTKEKIINFLDRGDYSLNNTFSNNVNEIMLYCKSFYALDISGKNYNKLRYLVEIFNTPS